MSCAVIFKNFFLFRNDMLDCQSSCRVGQTFRAALHPAPPKVNALCLNIHFDKCAM